MTTATRVLRLANTEPLVDPMLLANLAAHCRDQTRLRFKYAARDGVRTARDVEPLRLIHTGRVWYLVAWDLEREDWRTFRVDRIDPKLGVDSGERFTAREPPGGFEDYVARAITVAAYQYRARIRIDEPVAEARRHIPAWVGAFVACGDGQTELTLGAETIDALTALLVHTGVEFELLEPPELAPRIREVSKRLARGVQKLR